MMTPATTKITITDPRAMATIAYVGRAESKIHFEWETDRQTGTEQQTKNLEQLKN